MQFPGHKMTLKYLLCSSFLMWLHVRSTNAGSAYPAGIEMTMCGADNMVCTDGSYPWEEGDMRCCPYGANTAFCCKKDNPFVCFVKQIAKHVQYEAPKHLPCCYNCPMGEGKYYGIGGSSEYSSESFSIHEKYRGDGNKKAHIHSSSHDHKSHESHDHSSHKDVMRADDQTNHRAIPERPEVTPPSRIESAPMPNQFIPMGPQTSPTAFRADQDEKDDVSSEAFETCKMKGLATYFLDEDTVCCVGGATSQCCLKDRTQACSTDLFGKTQPIKGLNRDVLNSLDFSPDCAIRRLPTAVTAYLRPVQLHTPLAGARVQVSQVEGCDVRVLMNVHTFGLPAGYDYAFEVGNKTICGDSNDVSELLVTLPVNMRHERFKVPSSLSSVRDLRSSSLSVIRLEPSGQSQMLACGRFI
ncbi:uncharacterized protein LOC132203348 [Neocloeon triangulifer]|uniref:uncharacterized protein LOC132203348 n=1 Tax=Neocloeon triangulifer TaxID=2078957 RepID=UPI00286F7B2B|nr:uncharacterized protein LOC132203348 [Neocloeon triangulifer]